MTLSLGFMKVAFRYQYALRADGRHREHVRMPVG